MSPSSPASEPPGVALGPRPAHGTTATRVWRPYYGWVMVVVAAAAMVGTFPGRTIGLGILTERLLADKALGLTKESYGEINFWATLIGAAFCLGIGNLIDRYGVRIALTAVTALLGLSVLRMDAARGSMGLFLGVLLTRGFGQSALSIVSLSIVGKWFVRRLSWAMAVYSLLVAAGFSVAFLIGGAFAKADWRSVWGGIGLILIVAAPIAWLVARNSPEECGLPIDGSGQAGEPASAAAATDFTLGQALATWAFWVFGLSTSLFGLVAAGISLFNESILKDFGLTQRDYYSALSIGAAVAPVGNFLAGWLVARRKLVFTTACAMLTLSGLLLVLPRLSSYRELVVWTIANGIVGGAITVIFFTVWGALYGRLHLGKIQGAAQMLTVFASALGPLLLGTVRDRAGSYVPALWGLAIATTAFGIATLFVRLPARREPTQSDKPLVAQP